MKNYIYIILALLVPASMIGQQDYFGAGNDQGITVTSSSDEFRQSAENTINGTGLDADLMESSRFLGQATMGFDMDDIEYATEVGYETWIDEQQEMSHRALTPQMWNIWDTIYSWQFGYYEDLYLEQNPGAPITDSIALLIEEEIYGPWALDFHYAWWQNTIVRNDQLRQRVAYALSQILVISSSSDLIDNAETLTTYYDILLDNAFGNYKDILMDITLHPAMGLYLSHFNNPREIPAENLHPDENYAREVMQLFSIGLFELNQDGSRKVDSNGNEIPTYNNGDIKQMARVFTGLGPGGVMPNPWVDQPRFGLNWYLAQKDVPMVMYQDFHEPGEKLILGDLLIPSGQPGMQDIEMAIDYLFNHPNVGPFISRQLIQRLVKSNPSPGYISRVAAVFNNNGQGVRGDLGAVVKAILLDDEARTCAASQDPNNGKLLEPLLRVTQMAKAFKLDCMKDSIYVVDGETLDQTPCQRKRYWLNGFDQERNLRQTPLRAPSVFNFYLPDHQPVGEMTSRGLHGPEFKIHDSSTAINYLNSVFVATVWNYFGGSWEGDYNEDMGYLAINTDALESIMEDDAEEVLHYYDIMFTHGNMGDLLRNELRAFLNEQPPWTYAYNHVRGTLMLTLMAPDYTIKK